VPPIVGLEDTRPHDRVHPSPQPIRRWATFAFGASAIEDSVDGEAVVCSERYHLEVVRTVVGGALPAELAALAPSCPVARSEIESMRPPALTTPVLQGSLDLKLSSNESEAARLTASWSRSPWRVALVLLLAQEPSFWSLPRERRPPLYLGWHNPAPWGRVLRRLYRSRALPASQWDYLAYLEMQPEEVAHVREHLTELRNPKRNPAHAQVAREVELWMTKQVEPGDVTRVSERLRDRLGA
jgi:hypothetical protein